uniref:Uncharacterized protein n=1 Tax=Globisporangium ultimum (strain ATCC 200006 / CBS 805.95 / DAOM BR144) TaxID=431595 RepID=K3X442_GLOUD
VSKIRSTLSSKEAPSIANYVNICQVCGLNALPVVEVAARPKQQLAAATHTPDATYGKSRVICLGTSSV